MLQDYLRSAVYRSLTKPLADGCENEKNQTAACKTHTQSKTFSSKSGEPKNHYPVQGKCHQAEKKAMDYRNKGESTQLCHVPRGARELTQISDSSSNSLNPNRRPKHFARDPLRGSLNLEESLAMPLKLREASNRMSHSKLKQREETLEEFMSSRGFSSQEPRFSVDGSSRSYCEEQLRRRMSHLKYKQRSEFVEEELSASERMSLRKFGFEEKRHSVDGSSRNLINQMQRMSLFKLKQGSKFVEEDIGVEERANSSGNGFQKHRFSLDESSRTEELKKMSQLKFKHNSRLAEEEIGVEEILGSKTFRLQEPRLSVGGSSRDSIEELRRVIKDSLYQQNLLSRSPEDERTCIGQSLSSWKGSRLERFKGMISDTEGNLPSSASATPQAKKVKGPNLIAKLMGLEEVPLQTVKPIKKDDKRKSSNVPRPPFDIERPTARKLQLVEKKKASPNRKSLQEIIEAMQFKGLLKSAQVDALRIKLHGFDEKQLENYSRSLDEEPPPIVIMKPLYLPQWERGEVHKNLLLDWSFRNEEIQTTDLIQENKVLSKPLDGKEIKCIEKAKVDFSTVSHKLRQRKEAFKTQKKVDDRQKTPVDVTRKEGKKPAEAKRMSISQSSTTYTASAKSDKRLLTTKNKVSPVKSEVKNSANSMKEKKPPRAKSGRNYTDIQTNDKNLKDGKETNRVYEKDTFSNNASLPANKFCQKTEKEAQTCKKDDARENQEPYCEVMSKTSQAGKSPELSKEASYLPDKNLAIRKEATMEDDLMLLLLSSRSFLSGAQELYGIDAHQPIHHQRKGIEKEVMRNAKLYLDCGEEIMARKSHQYELMTYLILQPQMWDQTASFTLHQLAEEISSRIRTLTSYIKADHNVTSDDVLYVRLERDLRCKDVLVNAMWDIGWVSWGYPEEAVQLVCEVEERILSWLIAEVATELVW